jgi:hypothetical protein
LGGAIGDVIGETVANIADVLTPGESGLTAAERVEQGLIVTAGGIGAEGLGAVASSARQALKPEEILGRRAAQEYVAPEGERIVAREAAREGFETAEEIGQKLTPGQASQSPSAIALEQTVRGRRAGREALLQADAEAAQQFQRRLHQELDKAFGPAKAEGAKRAAGIKYAQIHKSYIKRLHDTAREANKLSFEVAHQTMGTQKFPMLGAARAIDDKLAELAVSPKTNRAAIKIFKRIKADLADQVDSRTFQKVLEQWGRRASGIEKGPFRGMSKREAHRHSVDIMNGLRSDLDELAKIYPGLKEARTAYKKSMANIDAEIGISVDQIVRRAVRKKVRGPIPRATDIKKPEALIAGLAKLEPAELKQAIVTINKVSPRHGRAIQRQILEHMVEGWTVKEGTTIGARLAKEGKRGLDVQRIAQGMLDQERQLKALLGPDHVVFKHMKKMQKVARRQAVTAGSVGEKAHIPIGSPIYLGPRIATQAQAVSEAIVVAIRPGKFAEIMLDPVKAKAFMQLAAPRTRTRLSGPAAALLRELTGKDLEDEED